MSAELEARVRRLLGILQPAFLCGFTLPDWIRLLRKNHLQVDAEYLPRALIATLGAGATSFLKFFEDQIDLQPLDEERWRHPVFILGLGRSGTTHLFHLLARDPQFCFSTRLECYNPHTFLTLRRLGLHRWLGLFPAKKRYMDNVRMGWLSPAEDKVALCVLTSSGSRLRRVFPRTFDGCLDAQGSSSDIKAQHPDFDMALAAFSRKLVFLHGRYPLFKSPEHTAAIPQILEVFPQAKFVTILRNPFPNSHLWPPWSSLRPWNGRRCKSLRKFPMRCASTLSPHVSGNIWRPEISSPRKTSLRSTTRRW